MAFTPIWNYARDKQLELLESVPDSTHGRGGAVVRLKMSGYVSLDRRGCEDLIRQLQEALGQPVRTPQPGGARSAFTL